MDGRGRWGRGEALKRPGDPRESGEQEEALRLEGERRACYEDRGAGKTPTPPGMVPTLAAFVDRQCSVKDYRASSEARERMAFRAIYQFPGARGGEIPLDAITPEWCEDLRLWRADAVSKRTRQLEERALCWLLDQAVTRRLLVANPMRALDTLKVPRHRAAWLEPNEVVAILDAARALDADPHHCRFPFLEVGGAVFAAPGFRAGVGWGRAPGRVGRCARRAAQVRQESGGSQSDGVHEISANQAARANVWNVRRRASTRRQRSLPRRDGLSNDAAYFQNPRYPDRRSLDRVDVRPRRTRGEEQRPLPLAGRTISRKHVARDCTKSLAGDKLQDGRRRQRDSRRGVAFSSHPGYANRRERRHVGRRPCG